MKVKKDEKLEKQERERCHISLYVSPKIKQWLHLEAIRKGTYIKFIASEALLAWVMFLKKMEAGQDRVDKREERVEIVFKLISIAVDKREPLSENTALASKIVDALDAEDAELRTMKQTMFYLKEEEYNNLKAS